MQKEELRCLLALSGLQSQMNDSSLLDAARLFMSVAANLHPNERWKMDDRDFALVVDKLRDTNAFASQFYTHDGRTGRACYQFNELMSFALHATFVSYLSPEYTHFLLNISPRLANEFLSKNTDEERRCAEEVVSAYWDATV